MVTFESLKLFLIESIRSPSMNANTLGLDTFNRSKTKLADCFY